MSLEGRVRDAGSAGITVTDDFRFLAEASAQLASSLDYNQTLRNVAELLVTRICEMASVFLVEDGKVSVAAWHHAHAEKREMLEGMGTRDISPGVESLVRSTIESCKSMVVDRIDDEVLADLGVSETKADQYRRVGISTFLLSPLVTHGRAIGVLCCICTEGH